MRSLKALHLYGPAPNNGLQQLAKLNQLRGLVVQDVTDAKLAQIVNLTGLEHLHLQGTISDDGLAQLEPLVELQELTYNHNIADDLKYLITYGYEDSSIADAIKYFHEKTNIAFRFDSDTIGATGVAIDEVLVTDSSNGLPLRNALDRMLTPHGLGFRIESDALVITSREEVDRAQAGIRALQKKLPKLKVIIGW